MSNDNTTTGALIASILGDQPDLVAALTRVHESALDSVDQDLLDLCRQRIALLLGSGLLRSGPSGSESESIASLPTSPSSHLTPIQRACLEFTDHFVNDVASMPDEVVENLRTQLGDAGLLNFTNALLVVEQRQRFHAAISRLLPEWAA